MKSQIITEKMNLQIQKKIEGSTIRWGINQALKQNRNANLIYHTGDMGKEPMIILFANNPNEILEYLKKIISKY